MRFMIALLLLTTAGGSQGQQVYRCLNPAQTELEYSDKPCAEGSSAALVDVTPNSAATAGALSLGGANTAIAPAAPSGSVNVPFKDADQPSGEEDNVWPKSNPKAEASRPYDQESLRPRLPGLPK